MRHTGYVHAAPTVLERVGSAARGRRVPEGFRPLLHPALREQWGQVWDQGVNACTGFALTKLVSVMHACRMPGASAPPALSAFSVYTAARRRRTKNITDTGAATRDAVWAWNRVGACTERLWPSWSLDKPLQRRHVNDYPSGMRRAEVLTSARYWRHELAIRCRPIIDRPSRIPERIAHSLDKLQGVLVAIPISDDFDRGTGVIQMQPPTRGWHLVAVIDWRSRDGAIEFLIANSWGEDWGEGGFRWASRGFIAQSRATFYVELQREAS